MKNTILPIFLLFSSGLWAQSLYKPKHHSLEAGFLFGLANYSGDLTEHYLVLSESHLGFGAHVRYFLNEDLALRANLFVGTISGDDKHAQDPTLRRRSMRFGTDLFEVGLLGEWYFFGKNRFEIGRNHALTLSPYGYLGIGGTFSGANASFYGAPEDRDVFLTVPFPEKGLRQRFLIAPMGGGIRAAWNDEMSMGVELGWRPVFSDDLDGVRLNGNPKSDDWYFFGGLTLSFVLNKSTKSL